MGPQPAEGGSVLQVAAGPEAPSDGGAAGRGPGGGGSRQRARPVAEGPGPGSRGRLAAGGRGAQVGPPLGRLRLAGAVGSSRALSPSPSSPALRVHRLTSALACPVSDPSLSVSPAPLAAPNIPGGLVRCAWVLSLLLNSRDFVVLNGHFPSILEARVSWLTRSLTSNTVPA